MITRLLN